MLYKRSISIIVFVLLILAILVAIWFVQKQKPDEKKPYIDFTNRIHTSLYQNATDVWDAALATDVFERSPSTAIHLSWQKPTQTYNHFLITVTNAETGWTHTESGEHERITLDVSDLLPDTKYTFVVQACADPICTSWLIANQEISARTQTSTTSNASP